MVIFIILSLLIIGLVGAAYLTNPFNQFTIIKRPFVASVDIGIITATNENHKIEVRQQYPWKVFSILKNFIHILSSRYVRSPRSDAQTVDDIIADIHAYRFDPEKLLLTSGDHFSALFVRNLGVFYYPMLDTRVQSTELDWHNRQTVYLQTVAYALGVYEKYPIPTTTIVPTGKYHATCVNIYAYPPDTVYALLYALSSLLGRETATPFDYGSVRHELHTQQAAAELMAEYSDTLQKLYAHYRTTVLDTETGLIRRGLHLSGAKDITRRDCSFYDNVVFWKTTSLAMELGLIAKDTVYLSELKKRIIDTFWIPGAGYFLEDLSEEGIAHGYYSSDWLIVLVTGFLDPANETDRAYYERCVAYIRRHGIDKPFPLRYHPDRRAHRQFFVVRLAVAAYGGDAIWSYWGMEYIKLLIVLYKHTGKRSYRTLAGKHLKSYERNMLLHGGFPEVYDSKGDFLQTWLYRSIRQTGWVIGFEQARAMWQSVGNKK